MRKEWPRQGIGYATKYLPHLLALFVSRNEAVTVSQKKFLDLAFCLLRFVVDRRSAISGFGISLISDKARKWSSSTAQQSIIIIRIIA